MSKFIHKKIQVDFNNSGIPARLYADKYDAQVSTILDCWHDTGCWWEGESEKVFYRISCPDYQVLEIFKDLKSGEWFLYKIYD